MFPNVLGTVFLVKELAQAAHDNGAIFVLDGHQGVVVDMPVDVQDIGCDFYAFRA